jgi:hypothetical protein
MNIQEVIERAEPGRIAITGDTITVSHYPDPPDIFRINGEEAVEVTAQ